MGVSIRGPVWRGPCSHPFASSWSLFQDSRPYKMLESRAGAVTGCHVDAYRFVRRRGFN